MTELLGGLKDLKEFAQSNLILLCVGETFWFLWNSYYLWATHSYEFLKSAEAGIWMSTSKSWQ